MLIVFECTVVWQVCIWPFIAQTKSDLLSACSHTDRI
jgi:hypothetical protein